MILRALLCLPSLLTISATEYKEPPVAKYYPITELIKTYMLTRHSIMRGRGLYGPSCEGKCGGVRGFYGQSLSRTSSSLNLGNRKVERPRVARLQRQKRLHFRKGDANCLMCVDCGLVAIANPQGVVPKLRARSLGCGHAE